MTEGRLNHMPHLGIVAGTADGAALCYRTLCHEAERLTGGHAYPEITMHALPLEAYLASIDAGDWSGVAALMSRSASVLAQAGAELIICRTIRCIARSISSCPLCRGCTSPPRLWPSDPPELPAGGTAWHAGGHAGNRLPADL